jgi:UDP-N-acetylglucosamine--N-acetylmuramyl-(pentapeptide) pyrophosphoryl-undecaprenol N-acetylglucosamine transferase
MGQEQKSIRLLITGGGTGGHLFPGIAAAEALCKRLPGSEVMFVGTHRKMDKTSLSNYGFMVRSIHSHGIKGKSIGQLAKAVMVLPVSILESMYHIIRYRPQLVVGVGGYVTGPVIAAARLLGRVTIIHEQNSVPGLANRKLGRLVRKVCLSLPGSEKYFDSGKIVLTGNPVRKEILDLAGEERQYKKGPLTILILGGSQGATGVNRLVVEALTGKRITRDVRVIHQTGLADVEKVQEAYKKSRVDAEVKAFFHDMVSLYRRADLVISRAGATTLVELAVLGKPAILIPYPYAADNHQEINALYYVDGEGAIMFKESELTGDLLAEATSKILENETLLLQMGENMKKLGYPSAAEKIVDVCLQQMGMQK